MKELFTTEWVDFVVYPRDPARVCTCAERLAVEGASPEPTVSELRAGRDFPVGEGFRITQSRLLELGDRFEAAYFDGGGDLVIWTDRGVWYLERGTMERIRRVPRHPDFRWDPPHGRWIG